MSLNEQGLTELFRKLGAPGPNQPYESLRLPEPKFEP